MDVIALNWKWLFIYPQYGVASLNELTIPTGTPINFRLTSESMMNAFFVPQLGSMVYTMAGMQTRLHLIADHPGTYLGQSAAYSGAGFSDMHFKTLATSRAEFDAWVSRAKASGKVLDRCMALSPPGCSTVSSTNTCWPTARSAAQMAPKHCWPPGPPCRHPSPARSNKSC